MKSFIVKSHQGDLTLLAFLREAMVEYPSVKAIKRAIDAKKCKINGRVEYFSTHKVKTGDKVEIDLAIETICKATTLFEDEHLIIFDKPSGKTSESFEGYYLVHRLDKETSGAFIMAKTKHAQEKLLLLFKERKIDKEYLAICDGKIALEKWKVDNYLEKKASYQGGGLYGKVPKEKGKRAITNFEKIQAKETATLVTARPITGRTHQIRVHLKDLGHPVLGDWQYSKTFKCPVHPTRIMLHAKELNFIHPFSQEPLTIKAPTPKDFLQMQKTLFGA